MTLNTTQTIQTISVAPMMDWTDRYCRYFHRILSPNIRVYTEMITDQAILHGHLEKLLAFDPIEHPIALQLGGSDPEKLYRATEIVLNNGYGYDEINLNLGCPSDRVQAGRFGLCLMKEPERVIDCLNAIAQAISETKHKKTNLSSPILSAKTRTGVDSLDSYDFLENFIFTLQDNTPCKFFIIHARKGWLSGLSPKENREIPPLDYERVYQIKKNFPNLTIHINGGIKTLSEIQTHLTHLDGVMLGRVAYHQPYLLAQIEKKFFSPISSNLDLNLDLDLDLDLDLPSREAILEKLAPWISSQIQQGVRPHQIFRHMLGLYHGTPCSKKFKNNPELFLNNF